MKQIKTNVKEIIHYLGDDVQSIDGEIDDDLFIDNIPDSCNVTPSSLDWINVSKENKQAIAEKSSAKVLVVDPSIEYSSNMRHDGKILIKVAQPRNALARIAANFFITKPSTGIHPSAIIHNEAQIHPSAHIGAGVVIGKATIGAGTILMPNVVVYDDVVIGDKCIIQAGAVIGTDGLGCSRDTEGRLTKFPHLGGVRIGNNVEIGANCQIAKGAFSDTTIENGCKINGLCFIAHNCHLEENVWITGHTMLAGSVHVSKNTTIFSNVIIREQRSIGEGVTIGMGSVVTKNIPNHETWLGSPAHKVDK